MVSAATVASEETWDDGWSAVDLSRGHLLEGLVRKYLPDLGEAKGALGATCAATKWVDPMELPGHDRGEVAAVQIVRPPNGFGAVRLGARCCYSTPRLGAGSAQWRGGVLYTPVRVTLLPHKGACEVLAFCL